MREVAALPGRKPHIPAAVQWASARLARTPPIYCVAVAMLAGDGLGNSHVYVPIPFAIAAAMAAAVLFLAARPTLATAIAMAAIAAAATAPVHDLLEPPSDPLNIRRFADGAQVTIEGRLIREAEPYHDRTHLFMRADRAAEATSELRPAHGVVRVTILEPAAFEVGQEVRVTARIRFPRNYGNPGEFDYESYQARQGVTATMVVTRARRTADSSIEAVGYHPQFWASSIERIRGRIGAFIDANLGHPEGEEMRALIIGDRGGISERLRNTFALTGMAHLLVISGLHLSLVAATAFAAARFLLAFFPILMIRGYANKLAAIAAAIAVAAYASIAGGHVSTIRALVMVLAYLFAVIIDRAREVLSSLALAAVVICLAIPGSTADIGFQLSFASVLAIVLGMRRFSGWWEGRRRLRALPGEPDPWAYRAAEIVVGYLAVSFWALMGTAPLTAYHFNQFAVVGLVANAVVVPIMALAGTVLGLAAAAMSFVSMPPAGAILWVAGRLLATGTGAARWFVAWPMAWTRTFTPTLCELAIAYALLALWLCWPRAEAGERRDSDGTQPERPARAAPGLRLALLGALAAALLVDASWWIRDRYFNPDLRVTFLSVGQGDCAVVRFPGSRVMIVDGGGQFREFDTGEEIVAPFLWSRKIMHVDYMVLSHPELDHFGGFEFIASNFHPSQFWAIAAPSPDIKYLDLLGILADAKIPVRIVDSSFRPPKIGGVGVECLNPQLGEIASRNNSSMVLRLTFGPTSFLFTGDIEALAERSLMARAADLHATILKAPHHGSASSSTEAFVEMVHPAVVVISDGYRNRFGFPAREVVDRYRAIGAEVLRTDQDRAVEVDASHFGMELRTYSKRAQSSL